MPTDTSPSPSSPEPPAGSASSSPRSSPATTSTWWSRAEDAELDARPPTPARRRAPRSRRSAPTCARADGVEELAAHIRRARSTRSPSTPASARAAPSSTPPLDDRSDRRPQLPLDGPPRQAGCCPTMVQRGEGRCWSPRRSPRRCPAPYQAVYNASKSFTQSFALALARGAVGHRRHRHLADARPDRHRVLRARRPGGHAGRRDPPDEPGARRRSRRSRADGRRRARARRRAVLQAPGRGQPRAARLGQGEDARAHGQARLRPGRRTAMPSPLRWPDALLVGFASSMRTFSGPAVLAARGHITGKARPRGAAGRGGGRAGDGQVPLRAGADRRRRRSARA